MSVNLDEIYTLERIRSAYQKSLTRLGREDSRLGWITLALEYRIEHPDTDPDTRRRLERELQELQEVRRGLLNGVLSRFRNIVYGG